MRAATREPLGSSDAFPTLQPKEATLCMTGYTYNLLGHQDGNIEKL